MNNLYIEGINRNNMSQEKLQLIETYLRVNYKMIVRGLLRLGEDETIICVKTNLSSNVYDLEEITREINNMIK